MGMLHTVEIRAGRQRPAFVTFFLSDVRLVTIADGVVGVHRNAINSAEQHGAPICALDGDDARYFLERFAEYHDADADAISMLGYLADSAIDIDS